MNAQVLFYGTYPLLLQTYRLILERSGLDVEIAASPSQLRAVLDAKPVDLLILCSSLSEADCERALRTLGLLQSAARTLVLTPGMGRSWGVPANGTVNCLTERALVVDQVHAMLQTPAQPV